MRETHTNADMSHQNSIKYQIGEIKNSINENGLGNTIDKIKQRIFYKFKGVDFSTQNIYDLTRVGDYQEHGTALVSTSKDFFQKVFGDLEEAIGKKINKKLFIDYGSGKGAAIIHARNAGFEKTIGIEFAKELHEKALENIKKLNIKNVLSLYQDATEFTPPKETSVIYFFNPFDEVVMEKVIKTIISQKDNFENEVYVIYGNPSCNTLDKHLKLIKKTTHLSGARVNYYKI